MMMKEEDEYTSLFMKHDRQYIKTLLQSLRRIHYKFPSRVTHLKAYPTLLLSFCNKAESVSLSHLRGRSYFLLDTMAREFSSLTELSLTNCQKLCASALTPVVRNCTKLRVLDLSYSDIECDKRFINALIVHGASLERLHFGGIMPARRDLIRLAVSGRCKLTHYDLTYIEDHYLLALKGHHVTNLRLCCFRSIIVVNVHRVQQCCPQLTSLYVESYGINSFPQVLTVCSPACLLRLTICASHFKDECMSLLVSHCPRLQALDLRSASVTSAGLIHLCKLTELVALTLRSIERLNGDSLSEIMQKCRKIRALDISGNDQILDADVQSMLPFCSKLTILNLMGCRESELSHFALKAQCVHLQEFYMITAMREYTVIDGGDYSSEIRKFLVGDKVKSCEFRPMGVDMMDRCSK